MEVKLNDARPLPVERKHFAATYCRRRLNLCRLTTCFFIIAVLFTGWIFISFWFLSRSRDSWNKEFEGNIKQVYFFIMKNYCSFIIISFLFSSHACSHCVLVPSSLFLLFVLKVSFYFSFLLHLPLILNPTSILFLFHYSISLHFILIFILNAFVFHIICFFDPPTASSNILPQNIPSGLLLSGFFAFDIAAW